MSLNFKNELDFINSFTRNTDDKKVICGIGDDCAVIEYKPGLHLIITTDMIVENVHFKLKWHTPYQIGKKLMEINVSDIVSMGGIPKYAFLSMAIKKNTESIFFNEFFKGLYNSAEKHGVLLLGGDTTGGNSLVFNLTLTGEVNKKYLRLRSMASNGDIICVTGSLGGSTAGLNLLQNNLKGYLDDYLLPCSRTKEECLLIAEYANAMIDISDGLGSEIKHICRSSSKGALIDFNKIPVSNNTIKSASSLNKDPFEFALYGGEDYEILFTINKDNINQLKKVFYDFTEIGIILSESEGISIIKNNKKMSIKNGFDHFKNSIL